MHFNENGEFEPNWLHGLGSKHHIVPRSHLQRFTDSNGQLNVYSVKDGKTYKGKPENVFSVRDFYTYTDIEGDRQGTLEDFFSSIESAAAAVFSRLVNPLQKGAWILDFEERQIICLFVALQILRTEKARFDIQWLVAAYLEEKGNIPSTTPSREFNILKPQLISGLVEINVPNMHIRIISEKLADIAHQLIRSSIYVLFWDQPELLIGDNPVLLRPRENAKLSAGIGNVSEFVLPLDFSHALVIAPGLFSHPEGYHKPTIGAQDLNLVTLKQSNAKVVFNPEVPLDGLLNAWKDKSY